MGICSGSHGLPWESIQWYTLHASLAVYGDVGIFLVPTVPPWESIQWFTLLASLVMCDDPGLFLVPMVPRGNPYSSLRYSRVWRRATIRGFFWFPWSPVGIHTVAYVTREFGGVRRSGYFSGSHGPPWESIQWLTLLANLAVCEEAGMGEICTSGVSKRSPTLSSNHVLLA